MIIVQINSYKNRSFLYDSVQKTAVSDTFWHTFSPKNRSDPLYLFPAAVKSRSRQSYLITNHENHSADNSFIQKPPSNPPERMNERIPGFCDRLAHTVI